MFRLTQDAICPLDELSFAELGVFERRDLQRLLRAHIGVIAPDVLVIAEEFSEWDQSRRRIDLLGVDCGGNLVVIELKRDQEGGHMELQALRYAAMVSGMTFARAAEVFQDFLASSGGQGVARDLLLEHLGWDEPREEDFAPDTRIILVAADFGKELTTTVLWLNDSTLDIRCVQMKPYRLDGQVLVHVQQIVPLKEVEEYQVRVREKALSRREAHRLGEMSSGYWFMNTGEGSHEGRSWEDCRRYGFMLAAGGGPYLAGLQRMRIGDTVFAYLSGHGYVGSGEVTAHAVPFHEFIPAGHDRPLPALPLTAKAPPLPPPGSKDGDWCVAVRWLVALDKTQGVLRSRHLRATICQIRQPGLVRDLIDALGAAGSCDVAHDGGRDQNGSSVVR